MPTIDVFGRSVAVRYVVHKGYPNNTVGNKAARCADGPQMSLPGSSDKTKSTHFENAMSEDEKEGVSTQSGGFVCSKCSASFVKLNNLEHPALTSGRKGVRRHLLFFKFAV